MPPADFSHAGAALLDDHSRLRRALGEARLPAAVVDLDAVDHNLTVLLGPVRRSGKTLRVATKSIRCVELLRYLARQGGAAVQGWMTFDAAETVFLADRGFDDLLLAYPTAQPSDAALLAGLAARGVQLSVVVDAPEHLDALDRAARAAGTTIEVSLEIDLALRLAGGALHVGVLRSPVRSVDQARAMARAVRERQGLRLGGLMAYEAQIAGVSDRDPTAAPATLVALRAMKAMSRRAVASRRGLIAEALRRDGASLRLVNGGGTGSLLRAVDEPSLTEVTAGSGFVASHLFDHYDDLPLRPALFFALQVVRRPDPGVVTCAGGGYVASGASGYSRLPVPWFPPGLRLVDLEGAGEVQTPVRLPPGVDLPLGAPVFFRHAKAGELAERFASYHLVRGDQVEQIVPTYRGEGGCFL